MNSLRWIVVVGALTGLLNCTGKDIPPRAADTAAAADRATDTARGWAVAPTAHNLTCEPSAVRMGDTIAMRMTLPHGRSFHVRAPDGTPYIVVFHGEGQRDRGLRRSLMPPDSFATVTELRLDTRRVRAGAWVFGRDTNETVFRAPGTYRLIVGDDLETDGPSYAECLVTLSP